MIINIQKSGPQRRSIFKTMMPVTYLDIVNPDLQIWYTLLRSVHLTEFLGRYICRTSEKIIMVNYETSKALSE